jgi:hypothetical protein
VGVVPVVETAVSKRRKADPKRDLSKILSAAAASLTVEQETSLPQMGEHQKTKMQIHSIKEIEKCRLIADIRRAGKQHCLYLNKCLRTRGWLDTELRDFDRRQLIFYLISEALVTYHLHLKNSLLLRKYP